jgi:restriction system protein
MARRRDRKGAADDLLAIAAKLPWWASLVLAVLSFVLLHLVADQDVGSASSTKDIGTIAARGLFRSLANIGQYIVPLIFIVGAVVSVVGQRRRHALVGQVAESDSPAPLNEMTWREFEGLVQEAFRLRGYSVRRTGGDGPDGGVDLMLDRGAEKVLVQCKQWRAMRVGVSVVRELYGVMAAQGAAAGIVVTSGAFTPDAVEFASGRNVRLIAGPELLEMIREVRVSTSRADFTSSPRQPNLMEPARGCPRCGSPMVKREAKRGPNAGRAFFGCSRYPECRGTSSIDG